MLASLVFLTCHAGGYTFGRNCITRCTRRLTVTTATVSAKGWVVIPAPYRHRHHLTPGTKVQILDYGGSIGIVPAMANPVRDARGLLRGGRSLTEALLAERSEERRCDDAR